MRTSYEIDDELDTQFFLAKAYMADRQWENATAILEDLESSKGRIIADQVNPPIIWALAHYYQGVVYEESGQSDKAIDYYSKFLDIWKNGDPDLKPVLDARKRFIALRNSKSRS